LGLANYYRQFIRNNSSLTAPLDQLRNAKKILGSDNLQEHFKAIKSAFAKVTMLVHPNFTKTSVAEMARINAEE
jgi:hypothetical protein